MSQFQKFYQANRERVFAYLLRMTGDCDLAKDLTQESFVKLLERYRPSSFTVALVFKIARNAFYDDWRKQQRAGRLVTEQPLRGDPEQPFMVRADLQRVLAALQNLPEDDRDIISLVVSSPLDYSAIAGMTRLSVANVKVKVHRARAKLRKALETGDSL